jgi:hypothetical protein
MLKAVFPSVSVCSSPAHDSLRPRTVPASSHCLALFPSCPFLPAAFPQCVFPILSQLSAFSCCSLSSKRPSFDSQYLQLVAAPSTASSPSYAWWSHHSVSSCLSPRTSFGPISSLSSASLPRCLLPLSVVSVCPPAHSRSPVMRAVPACGHFSSSCVLLSLSSRHYSC